MSGTRAGVGVSFNHRAGLWYVVWLVPTERRLGHRVVAHSVKQWSTKRAALAVARDARAGKKIDRVVTPWRTR
jgi:hypothetical protein